MGLLGKNYDEDIKKLFEASNKLVTQLNKNTESVDKIIGQMNVLQKEILNMAIVQAQHKEMVSFLLRNTSFDANKAEDVQKELMEMMKRVRETEDKFKDIK